MSQAGLHAKVCASVIYCSSSTQHKGISKYLQYNRYTVSVCEMPLLCNFKFKVPEDSTRWSERITQSMVTQLPWCHFNKHDDRHDYKYALHIFSDNWNMCLVVWLCICLLYSVITRQLFASDAGHQRKGSDIRYLRQSYGHMEAVGAII